MWVRICYYAACAVAPLVFILSRAVRANWGRIRQVL